jgi:eukaryotic-like serine/threonine-protein kinase
MTLAPGTRLGPYEIQSSLGAGGMGEVYRARDTRLDRVVAVKILPEALAKDGDRLQRFEHEARVLSTLSHPNLLSIYDVGSQDGIHYLVSEFLEGHTLRELLKDNPLGVRRATDYGLQLAKGLSAAHEKGIVHRDLKPENIFVTTDGRVKILDFGLAKQSFADTGNSSGLTQTVQTVPGVVLGTVGYMAPEQVRGQSADARSDLFSFGSVLFEMLSGKRAFHGDTPADMMSAILKEDPPELIETGRQIPPVLEGIVRHCMEKNPQNRFQSAHDLAFNLEQLAHAPGSSASHALASTGPRRAVLPWLVPFGMVAVAAAAFFLGRRTQNTANPVFQQLTFQRGRVLQARFSPDGQTILYSAAWNGEPSDVYSTRADGPGARSLDLKGGQVLSVSSTGDLAVLLKTHASGTFSDTGTLAIVPLSGGAPHEVAESILYADFSPDGKQLAVIHDLGPRSRLEYPAGKSLYEFNGWLSHLRISPKGDKIAFAEHPTFNDSFGSLVVTDLLGNRKVLKKDWYEILDLAWGSQEDEVWVTASDLGGQRSVYAVTLDGKARQIFEVPGNLVLKDRFRDGRLLLVRENQRRELSGILAGESKQRDFSWFDWTYPDDITPDGKAFTFHEAGAGGGKDFAVFLRKTDGSPPVRLGSGSGAFLSPDGKWVMAGTAHSPAQIFLLPVGVGEARQITNDSMDHQDFAWLPDGKHIVVQGTEPGRRTRLYTLDLDGGSPKVLTPEGYSSAGSLVSPDGKDYVAACLDLKPCLIPLSGGEPRSIPGVTITDGPIQWSEDSRFLYMYQVGALPSTVERVDLATGKRTPWKTLAPADLAGVHGVTVVRMTPDARVCLYSYLRTFSDLYLVRGLK